MECYYVTAPPVVFQKVSSAYRIVSCMDRIKVSVRVDWFLDLKYYINNTTMKLQPAARNGRFCIIKTIIIKIIIIIIIIIIIDIYKAQYPLIAQTTLQYNNMVKTI